jgi:hypothetical protein
MRLSGEESNEESMEPRNARCNSCNMCLRVRNEDETGILVAVRVDAPSFPSNRLSLYLHPTKKSLWPQTATTTPTFLFSSKPRLGLARDSLSLVRCIAESIVINMAATPSDFPCSLCVALCLAHYPAHSTDRPVQGDPCPSFEPPSRLRRHARSTG